MSNAIEVGQFYASTSNGLRVEVLAVSEPGGAAKVYHHDTPALSAWMPLDALKIHYEALPTLEEAQADAMEENDEHHTERVAIEVLEAESMARWALDASQKFTSDLTDDALTDYQSAMAERGICIVIGCHNWTPRMHMCPKCLRSTMVGE